MTDAMRRICNLTSAGIGWDRVPVAKQLLEHLLALRVLNLSPTHHIRKNMFKAVGTIMCTVYMHVYVLYDHTDATWVSD